MLAHIVRPLTKLEKLFLTCDCESRTMRDPPR